MSRPKTARGSKRRCYFCGCRLTVNNRTIDHLIPLSRGGLNVLKNRVWCCNNCNNEKMDMTLMEYKRYKIYALTMKGKQLREYCEKNGILFDTQKRYERNMKEKLRRRYGKHGD